MRTIRNIYNAFRGALRRHGFIGIFGHGPYYLRHFRELVTFYANRQPGASLGLHREAARHIEIDYSLEMPLNFSPLLGPERRKVAAIVHLFYEELACEFRSYLDNVPCNMDIYISTVDNFRADIIRRAFDGWSKGEVEIRVVPNRGRDIAPKLVCFRDIYDQYEYVLHLHSKYSQHSSVLASWRHFLLESLIGTEDIVTSIFHAFERHPQLGIVAPQHFEPMRQWINWGGNFKLADKLVREMGISLREEDPLDFPAGSMFWARSAALRPLLNLNLKTEDFDEESNQKDATLAHAIERIFFHACEYAGFDWIKIARMDLYGHTPSIIKVENDCQLSAFFTTYRFHLLDPRGIRPRKTHPEVVTKPTTALLDHVRDRALGIDLKIKPGTRVALGIVTYNNSEAQLRMAIGAARLSLTTAGLPTAGSLFLVDNGSDTAEYIKGDEFISRQPTQGNIGFGAGHNRLMHAAFASGHDFYIMINPDGALHPEAITAMVKMMQAAGGKALIEALQFPSEHPKPYDENTLDTPWVSGSCLAIPKSAFDDLGGFDEDFFMYCEDVDLSWRARAHGYSLKTCPRALFLHAVTNREMPPSTRRMIFESGIKLARKWSAPQFECWLEVELSALGFPVSTFSPMTVPKEWSRYADFSHQFSFAQPRW